MRCLLLFGIIENVIHLSFNGIQSSLIVLACVQALLIGTVLLKRNARLTIILRCGTLICCFFNAWIIMTPISYFIFGCASIMAFQTRFTIILTVAGIVFLSDKFDGPTVSEVVSLIAVLIGQLIYTNYQDRQLSDNFKQELQTKRESIQIFDKVDFAFSPKKDEESQMEFNLFKKLLTAFPDGVSIIDENYQSKFCNSSFRSLMSESSADLGFQKLLDLKNAINSDQDNITQLFMLLDKKIKQKQYSIKNENGYSQYFSLKSAQEEEYGSDCLPNDEDVYHNLSQTQTIREEVKQIFRQLHERGVGKSIDFSALAQIKFYEDIGIICQGAQQKLFHVILKPYRSSSRSFILLIVRDITHINKIAALEQMNVNKSQMLSNVAHEFRTPLNLIIDWVQRMAITADHNTQQSYLFPIKSMASQLLNLVHDLLDVAQLKAGRFNLVYVKFRFHEFLTEIINLMMIQANSRQLYLKLSVNQNVPKFIRSDPNRIKQVIMNLLTNSMKFTKRGGITVYADYSDGFAEIRVKDTGIGIPIGEQNKLFKAFGRIDSQFNPTGVGLGLMISNILAQKLGQGLQVFSEGERKGSTFSFKITSEDDLESSGSCNQDEGIVMYPKDIPYFKQHNLVSQTECDCVRVLVVDDEPFNIISIERQLMNQQIKVDSALSADEALQKIDNYIGCVNHLNYKIILLDIEMPVVNGYQACKLIRMKSNSQIIACSAHNKEEVDISDFDGFIEKPVRSSDVCNLLTKQDNTMKE